MLQRKSLVHGLIAVLLLAATLGLVWWPVFAHYWVRTPSIDAAQIELHRQQPADDVLAKIIDQPLISDTPIAGQEALGLARKILGGRLELPKFEPLDINPSFAPEDLEKGFSTLQLLTASWIVPDLLLRAYELDPNEAFFDNARRHILAFSQFEAKQILPRGFIWNDHAVATRASVLARFWRLYRTRADYKPDEAYHVLLHAARLIEVLTAPSHFTFATNHGFMQNLALLQLAASFPGLPNAARAKSLGLARLHDQAPFYVNDEGVVLEHSAGYHVTGTILLGFAIEAVRLVGEPVPEAWQRKYERTLEFYAQMRRPDASLPMYGNTTNEPKPLPETLAGAKQANNRAPDRARSTATYPVAGYAIWWNPARGTERAGAVQTIVPWSYFPGHGHKLADEMSLLVWADGVDWLTNNGYWPYDHWGRSIAYTWQGSGGPHVRGEAVRSNRDTRIRAAVDAPTLRALDLERTVEGGLKVRRQIVHIGDERWLAFDTHEDPSNRPLEVLWTTTPRVKIEPQGATNWLATSGANAPRAFQMTFRGSDGFVANRLHGNRDPYGGWVTIDRVPTPAHAVKTSIPRPGGWMLASLALRDATVPAPNANPIANVQVTNAERWRVELQDGAATLAVAREDRRLTVTRTGDGAQAPESFMLQPGADVSAQRAEIHRAFAQAKTKYPAYRNIEHYRLRATWFVLGAWIAMVLVLAAAQRVAPRPTLALRRLGWLGWVGSSLWLAFGYFTW
jgi:hypothetical protein